MTAAVAPQTSSPTRRGRLALALQETFTAIARLRANRQVAADSESFRTHMKSVLGTAEQEGRRVGYPGEDVRLALFAAIAFLDESVLNSRQPMFADWPRRPLQDEIFQLCLLLGFRGRYGASQGGELHAYAARTGEKIARVRGAQQPLAPHWRPPQDRIEAPRDRWARPLLAAAIASVVLTIALYAG